MPQYLIVLEPGANNWSAYAPDLPGVVTTGKDADDTTERMREAIAAHLYELQQDGDEIPVPTSTPETHVSADLGNVLCMIEPAP
ncbi:type II toxin-antitoxin system HicB family antitoxin [Deinococcus peraridilitoris]|uniref:HicB-like antitoxin of toxin-antitoxin system domain-containing protein n=1 Tax=Deinococcus peraridilitoris (strain DSM 19664 / LMG 22246 / CIP 109416 / KR-200) TaxID=937777 RepID=L0A8L1_DEIPD|nr:type II toxin-antitoxin system HicB family antitoxin [Deinococcus peraridilitoris]AFZ69415.1 hypothetical protein Deipe_4024 [Deinococcus peraridilitoris DSM 19664]